MSQLVEGEGIDQESVEECPINGVNHQARMKDAQNVVTNHMLFAVGFGSVPVPIVDIVGLSATQLNMLRKVSEVYGEAFTDQLAKKAIISLVGGSLSVPVAAGVASMLKFLPVIGSSVGALSIASVGSASTYAVGQVFIRHFESGGTLFDFDSDRARIFFKEEFERGKEVVQKLVKAKKQEKKSEEAAKEEAIDQESSTQGSQVSEEKCTCNDEECIHTRIKKAKSKNKKDKKDESKETL